MMEVCCGSEGPDFDVVVIGSGAAGLTAALSALDSGATVAVIEKATTLGGTSALSGGMLWLPANSVAAEAGYEDSREAALAYLAAVTKGRANAELLKAHVDRGQELLDYLEESSDLRFRLIGSFPDYYPEFEGGRAGGRSIEPEAYELGKLGALRRWIRDDPRPPFSQWEYFEVWRTYSNFPWDELDRRRQAGIVTRGTALVAPLVRAVADRGGTIVAGCRTERLITDDGRVVGVRAGNREFRADSGVVLASGGFEWNDELCMRLLSGPVNSRCSLPTNVGDGLKMAIATGADIANTNEAWWGIHSAVPGVEAEGRELGTIVTVERSLPGSVVVNTRGERFTNESGSYYTFGKVLAAFDSVSYDYRNLPAYLIADAAYFHRYGLLGARDLDALPDWLTSADTLPELAAKLGVAPDGLTKTIDRFNGFARDGRDADFRRGDSAYDRYFGDDSQPHPNLGPISEPPFVALELQCGAIGTKGGVVTDVDARALDPWGEPIEGLYAVGNVAAHPIAFGYCGAGSTLGPGMTMARAAGRAVGRLVRR
jgi:3-oxosteroid 1-dehydrogenase